MKLLPYYFLSEHSHRFDRDPRYVRIYPGIYLDRHVVEAATQMAERRTWATADRAQVTGGRAQMAEGRSRVAGGRAQAVESRSRVAEDSVQATGNGTEVSMARVQKAVDPARLHLTKLKAISQKLPNSTIFSHISAARIYGFTVPNSAHDVHIYQKAKPNNTNSDQIIRHTTTVGLCQVREVNGMRVADPFRTVIDCVRILPVHEAMILADSAARILSGATRWNQAETLEAYQQILKEFARYLTSMQGARHIRTARAILSHMTPLADSPYESILRLLLLQTGLPQPEVQPHLVVEGKSVFPDLLFRHTKGSGNEHQTHEKYSGREQLSDLMQHSGREQYFGQMQHHSQQHQYQPTVVEFDGAIKYTDASFGASDSTLLEEKRREDALRRAGYNVVRFTAADLMADSSPMRQLLQLVPRQNPPDPHVRYLRQLPQ